MTTHFAFLQIKDVASTIGAKRKTVEVLVLCNGAR